MESETSGATRSAFRHWTHGGGRRLAAAIATLAMVLTMSGLSAPARADDYEPDEAGHPVRILGYVLHPIGVILDYVVMRPAHWIGSHEPFKTLFGHED